MATVTLPFVRVGSPRPVSFFQVEPPSVDLYRPLPGPPLSRPQVWISSGHIPAKRMRELFGSITRLEQPVFSSTKSAFSQDRKSTRLNSSNLGRSYAVFC